MNSSLHLARKYARIFVLGHYLFPEARESLEVQIMSNDKYPSIFLRQMEAITSIILQIFFTKHTVLKNGKYHLDIPQF